MRPCRQNVVAFVGVVLLLAFMMGCASLPKETDTAKKGTATMDKAMVILYVADQERSKAFYKAVLDVEPLLDVPGMTEFPLTADTSLGLMPEKGTVSFLGDSLPAAETGNGIPRCELYLFVDDPGASFKALVEAGGKAVSEPAQRPWGDVVAYGADPDGHVLAFAKRAE